MGKEARIRKEKRNGKLARLAQEDPQGFEREWAKRIDTWACQIREVSKDRVTFAEEAYQSLLKKYPSDKSVLESISVSRYPRVYIYIDTLNDRKEDLSGEVVGEILRYVKQGTLIGEPIFSIVDNAIKTLENCGPTAVKLQSQETADILNNECCRAIAPHIGREIYRVNAYRKPEPDK